MSWRTILILLLLTLFMYYFGCKARGGHTGREYMPDMVHSQAYETYGKAPQRRTADNQTTNLTNAPFVVFADGKSAREPVKGTIPRGYQPYAYANTPEGYEAAATLINPYAAADKATLEQGKMYYTTYCAVCHGESGQGDGSISATGPNNGPFAGVINYFSAGYMQMEEGKMFHSIHYGKNNMGSYAGQLTKDERWKIVAYIKSMQAAEYAKTNKVSAEEAMRWVRGSVGGKMPSAALAATETAAHTQDAAAETADTHAAAAEGATASAETDAAPVKSKSELEVYATKPIAKGTVITLRNVFFNMASAKLKGESKDELDRLADIMNKNKNLKIEVGGHTDDTGLGKINMKLSKNRAESVVEYLVSKGIDKSRFQAVGYGGNKPVTTEKTSEARAKNRRVEIKAL